jgi:aspartate/glutamate racemase
MLLQPQHTGIKLYDTTAIHAQQAVKRALESFKSRKFGFD